MDLDDIRSLINASAFAVSEGIGHTVQVTIRWSHSRTFDPRQWLECQSRLFQKMSKWLQRNGVPVSYAWVREMGRVNGPHTHAVLHLPVELWGKYTEFMMQAGEFEMPDASGCAIKLEGGVFGTMKDTMRAGALIYLLKSVDPQIIARAPAEDGGTRRLADALGIRPEATRLPIAGLRCNASHSIGATARQKAGWQEMRTLAELHAYLHPPKTPKRRRR